MANTCKCKDGCKCKAGKVQIKSLGNGVYKRTALDSKYIVEYNRDACIGAASCAAVAPFTFVMDEENKAVLVGDDNDNDNDSDSERDKESRKCDKEDKPREYDDDDTILAAAQSCPVFAIVIKNKETGEQIFPPLE
jgi:ferredoxin